MKKTYIFVSIVLALLINYVGNAQVPDEWHIINSELSSKIITTDNIIKSKGIGSYCTKYAGDLLLANSNRGYTLFTQTPPGAPNIKYENNVLAQVDTMLMMMDSLGYKAVDITISYPILLNDFPNSQVYLDFYKKVYSMARSMGFTIIENCQVTIANTSSTETNLANDIKNYYFNPNGTHDTINTMRYLSTMNQMMQTILDSLQPDYMTLEMEPQTQAAVVQPY